MKYEEELARQYLLSIGFVDTDIIYEPVRNETPDFLVEGRIAVEVRRLNQNDMTTPGKLVGRDSLQIDLLQAMEEVLHSFGPPKQGNSWSVRYIFGRPLPYQKPDLQRDLRCLKAAAKKQLTAFLENPTENEFSIDDRFTMELNPWNGPAPDCFHLRSFCDQDCSGYTVILLEKNIQLCIDEKTDKIKKARSRYPEWWLILVDQIGYGERESITVSHNWNKVIVLNPLNPTDGYELQSQ